MLPKFFAFTFFLSFILFPLSSLPGVQDLLPTESGQYVYYQDLTFYDETYIGFLQYDEATYALRYCSPQTREGSSTIELLISIDPKADHVVMTGERIVGKLSEEDTDKLNYLHDMFYELAAKRKKINGLLNPQKENTLAGEIAAAAEIPFFGENLTISYDFIIPIFNIKSIADEDNKLYLQAITMGQLENSSDTSFSSFNGIQFLNTDSPQKSTSNKSALDKSWTQIADNFWLLNSEALMYVSTLNLSPDSFANENYNTVQYLSRKLSFGNSSSLVYLPAQNMYIKNGCLVIFNVLYDPEIQGFSQDIKIIDFKAKPEFIITGFTIYYAYYCSNEAYFLQKVQESINF